TYSPATSRGFSGESFLGLFRVSRHWSFHTSLSMLLPATIHRALSCTNTLAAWRGFHGVWGNSYQFTPSAEYQTSFRFPDLFEYPSSAHMRSSKTATSWYCRGSHGASSTCRFQFSPSAVLQTSL